MEWDFVKGQDWPIMAGDHEQVGSMIGFTRRLDNPSLQEPYVAVLIDSPNGPLVIGRFRDRVEASEAVMERHAGGPIRDLWRSRRWASRETE